MFSQTYHNYFLLIILFLLPHSGHTEERIPDDVRYMIEDIYGTDKSKWPKPIYSKDINADGMPDWLVQQPGCKQAGQCVLDTFICAKSEAGKCLEYCYTGGITQTEILNKSVELKCQSTC